MIFEQMIDSMAYINTKNYSKTGKSMDKEIIPKYLWIQERFISNVISIKN